MSKYRKLFAVTVGFGLAVTALGCGSEKSSDPVLQGTADPNLKPVGRGPSGGAAGGAPAKGGGGTVTAEPLGKN